MMKALNSLVFCLLCLLPVQTGAFAASPLRRTLRSTSQLMFQDEKTVVVQNDDVLQTEKADKKLKAAMELLTKPRPYPLFLAEKAAGTIEGVATSIAKPFAQLSSDEESPQKKKKERVVVLGVGWGAAALLKEIDTDLYDVTVISPRNQYVGLGVGIVARLSSPSSFEILLTPVSFVAQFYIHSHAIGVLGRNRRVSLHLSACSRGKTVHGEVPGVHSTDSQY